jgi:tRNA nucleotidyltransferase (CCA-adding enzyme)
MENIGVDGGHHHAETVDVHLVTAFNIARQLTNNKGIWVAALLHDIAKAQTRTEDELEGEDGNVTETHFHKHEDVGADYAKEWMTELKFSNEEVAYVECLIRNHMWQYSQTLTKRSFINHFKSFEVAGVTVFDYVMLKYCDNQANQSNPRVKFGDFVSNSPLIQKYYQLKFSKEPFRVSDLVVKGQDLIDLGFTPGKTMGEILQKLYDLVLDGDLRNERAPLLHYVKTEFI